MKTKEEIYNDLKKTLDAYDIQSRRRIEKFQSGDFYTRFPWDGEELFKDQCRIRFTREMINIIDDNPSITPKKLEKYYTDQVLKTTIMQRSTGQLHSLTSLWEKEVIVELLNRFL